MEIPQVRRFDCQTCDAALTFDDTRCRSCSAEIGYFLDADHLGPIEPGNGATYRRRGAPDHDPDWWRCLNTAWGCNWMVPLDDGNVWCAACRLTRGRPDESNPDAVRAWSHAEAAKRRLVAQLYRLGLPVAPPSRRDDDTTSSDDGLVIDLVYLPDSVGVTGHRPGVITLDLREVDPGFREAAREHFGEQYRTVLGHLRHETGHHFWQRLVVRADALDDARELFGDERADYAAALETHYGRLRGPHGTVDVPHAYISDYASVHPSEDWAECFAHYLHLRDGLETAESFGLGASDHDDDTLEAMLSRWRELSRGVDEVSRALGQSPAYGVVVHPEVEPKLRFVHERITGAARAR